MLDQGRHQAGGIPKGEAGRYDVGNSRSGEHRHGGSALSSRDGGRPKKTRAYSKPFLSGNMGRQNEAKERTVMKRR